MDNELEHYKNCAVCGRSKAKAEKYDNYLNTDPVVITKKCVSMWICPICVTAVRGVKEYSPIEDYDPEENNGISLMDIATFILFVIASSVTIILLYVITSDVPVLV